MRSKPQLLHQQHMFLGLLIWADLVLIIYNVLVHSSQMGSWGALKWRGKKNYPALRNTK